MRANTWEATSIPVHGHHDTLEARQLRLQSGRIRLVRITRDWTTWQGLSRLFPMIV